MFPTKAGTLKCSMPIPTTTFHAILQSNTGTQRELQAALARDEDRLVLSVRPLPRGLWVPPLDPPKTPVTCDKISLLRCPSLHPACRGYGI